MPRPDVSAERTQQIIDAAIAVFSRLGFNNSRMEDIAKEAGLSKGTLYLYFNSKDELIGAILNAVLARELENAHQLLLNDEATAVEKLDILVNILVEDLRGLKPFIPLYLEFIALAGREETFQEAIKQPFHDFIEVFTTLVEQGISKGEFHQVDAQMAALTIGTLFDGTILLWAYDSEMFDLEQQIKASLQLLLDGLSI